MKFLDKLKNFLTAQNFDTKLKSQDEIIYFNKSTYKRNVETIYLALENKLRHGASMIKNVIDYRTSWIFSDNITIEGDKQFLEYSQEVIDINNFLKEVVEVIEIEGKCLVTIDLQQENKTFKYNIYRIRDYDYKIKYSTELNDYIVEIEISHDKIIQKTSSQYVLFCPSRNKEESPSNVAYVIQYIQNVDKAIETLRGINNVLAVNTIFFETKDWTDAQRLASIMQGKKSDSKNIYDDSNRKWKIGDGLVAPAKPSVISIAKDSIESIKDEIITNLQIISGHTGVPIHLLGFPEMLSNRATAEEMAESIVNKVQNERTELRIKLQELLKKTAILLNNNFFTAYEINFRVTIPPTSMAEKRLLFEIYLPLAEKEIISKQTLREMIPDIDPEIESERLKQEISELDERISNSITKVGFQDE